MRQATPTNTFYWFSINNYLHKNIWKDRRGVHHLQVDDDRVSIDNTLDLETPLRLKEDLLFYGEQRVRLDFVAPLLSDNEKSSQRLLTLLSLLKERLHCVHV